MAKIAKKIEKMENINFGILIFDFCQNVEGKILRTHRKIYFFDLAKIFQIFLIYHIKKVEFGPFFANFKNVSGA